MSTEHKKDLFDNIKGPRDVLKTITFIIFIFWQSIATTLGLIAYIILIRAIKLEWYKVLIGGVLLAGSAIFFLLPHTHFEFLPIIRNGFYTNIYFWKNIFTSDATSTFNELFHYGFIYLWGTPVLFAGIWGMFDLIPNNAHEKELMAIQRAQDQKRAEVSDWRVGRGLDNLLDEDYDGTVLGVSKSSGRVVVVPDHYVNQIVLVLGTTGGGKSVTLRRFYKRAALLGVPLIIVDGKPTNDSINWVIDLARRQGKKFYGFNCGDYAHYDCLAQGSYTELKDKMITLKDEWESDYYRSIAEDYLQAVFEVLEARRKKTGRAYDLKQVIECLDYEELTVVLRELGNERLTKKVRRLENYNPKDITGLQAHLSTFIHSELGEYFEASDNMFSLAQAIEENAIVYFALPALKYPSYAKALGKLVANDIKTVIERHAGDKKIFLGFDEFAFFASEQVLNIINMGRAKGVHAIFGTQGLSDLKKVDETFSGQVLNCANTIICHRVNDQDSAEGIAAWAGTKDTFVLTSQIDSGGSTGLGSARRNKAFIVHPDDIKQGLQVGEAFYITKVDGFKQDKVKIKLS